MNTNIKTANKDEQVIRKELLINGGDLDLYLDLFITENGKTEKILSKKADSILANFMRILYLQMCRDTRDNVMGGTFYYLGGNFTGANITSLSSGTGGVFRINVNNFIFSDYPASGKITLGGFQGVSLDGRYNFTKISSSAIDIDGTTYSSGWVTGTGGGSAFFPITNLGNPYYWSFQSQGILVGSGTAAVTIDDQLLEKQIPNSSAQGGLTYGSTIVSQDTNDSTSAQITITRTFTNNTAFSVVLRELGMLQSAGSNNYYLLTMRDVLPSDITVGSGATLTVNYRIKTVLGTGTDAGGFLASFMRLMYRHVGQTSRAVFDIDNTSRTNYPSNSSFCVLSGGGINVRNPNEAEYQAGYKHGIVVGTGNTAVSMGDYYLQTPIQHGSGSGQMLYYGGFAEDFTVGSNYAQFSIYKAIENNSGASITVNEYALVCAADANTGLVSITNRFVYLFAVTRNVLSTGVTVLDQKVLKVVYTIKCVV